MHNKIILSFFIALYWASAYVYSPIISVYAEQLGATSQIIGMIGGVYGLSQMLLRIPIGITSDFFGRKKIFVICGALSAIISAAGLYFFQNIYAIVIFRFMSGVAASFWVVITVMYTDCFDKKDTTKAISYASALNVIGIMLSQLLGGYISDKFGEKTVFLYAIIFGVLSLILSLMLSESKTLERKKPLSTKEIIEVVKNKNLFFYCILGIVVMFVWQATFFTFTPLISKSIGATKINLATLSMLASLPGILVTPFVSPIFKNKLGIKKSLIFGFVILATTCISTPFISNLFVLYAHHFISGVGRGMIFPLLLSSCIEDIEINKRSIAMGVFQSLYGIGMFLGPFIFGISERYFGVKFSFIFFGLICFSIIFYINYFLERKNSKLGFLNK